MNMMHYAVESALHARGFLGRVKDGETAAFGMASEAESDSIERLVAAMQGETWSGLIPVDDLIDLYCVTCTARGCPTLALNTDIVADIRRRTSCLSKHWEAVSIREGRTLTF